AAEKTHAGGDAEPPRALLERMALRALPGNEQPRFRQPRQRLDDELVSLARNEMTDREQDRRCAVDAVCLTRAGALAGAKAVEIDAVAQDADAGGVGAELDKPRLQRRADGDDAAGVSCRPQNHAARH